MGKRYSRTPKNISEYRVIVGGTFERMEKAGCEFFITNISGITFPSELAKREGLSHFNRRILIKDVFSRIEYNDSGFPLEMTKFQKLFGEEEYYEKKLIELGVNSDLGEIISGEIRNYFYLERDYNNRYDPNAIKVMGVLELLMGRVVVDVGFIPAELAAYFVESELSINVLSVQIKGRGMELFLVSYPAGFQEKLKIVESIEEANASANISSEIIEDVSNKFLSLKQLRRSLEV